MQVKRALCPVVWHSSRRNAECSRLLRIVKRDNVRSWRELDIAQPQCVCVAEKEAKEECVSRCHMRLHKKLFFLGGGGRKPPVLFKPRCLRTMLGKGGGFEMVG